MQLIRYLMFELLLEIETIDWFCEIIVCILMTVAILAAPGLIALVLLPWSSLPPCGRIIPRYPPPPHPITGPRDIIHTASKSKRASPHNASTVAWECQTPSSKSYPTPQSRSQLPPGGHNWVQSIPLEARLHCLVLPEYLVQSWTFHQPSCYQSS